MNKDRENILCEYSDEESAFLKGALSSTEGTEDAKRFHMEMKSTEYTLCDFSMYGEAEEYDGSDCQDGDPEMMSSEEALARAFAESEKSPASEEYSVACDAHVSIDGNGNTLIKYRETLDGESFETTEIHFCSEQPGLVTICRSGMTTMVMTVEVGRRHSCVYRTPFMDFEMRVHALRVDNTISDNGGRLRLDYALEIRGAAAHRTIMDIKLTEA